MAFRFMGALSPLTRSLPQLAAPRSLSTAPKRFATSPPSASSSKPNGFSPSTQTGGAKLSATTQAPGQSPQVNNHPQTGNSDLDPLPSGFPSEARAQAVDPVPLPSAPPPKNGVGAVDGNWATSFYGMSTIPFEQRIVDILLAPVETRDIEIKPDGLIYLPEIKYRRILNRAFGPGGWGLAPRGETNVGLKIVSREYALVCLGRFVSTARGEQEYFDPSGIATATEGAKSNALMRCCKDLGIASELWDPRFIREFKAKHCVELFVEHIPTKKKRKLWRRKDTDKFEYPYKET